MVVLGKVADRVKSGYCAGVCGVVFRVSAVLLFAASIAPDFHGNFDSFRVACAAT